jgi:hypothetical protein
MLADQQSREAVKIIVRPVPDEPRYSVKKSSSAESVQEIGRCGLRDDPAIKSRRSARIPSLLCTFSARHFLNRNLGLADSP